MNVISFKPPLEARTAQGRFVLDLIREGKSTTSELQARGVLAPAARVMELRRAGYKILTVRAGRQAWYVLDEHHLSARGAS